MQKLILFPKFKNRSLFFKIIVISVFSILLLNSIIFYLHPFSSDTIFEFYTKGYFTFFSSLQRIILGFVPISIGDIIYIIVGGYLLLLVFNFIVALFIFRFHRLTNITARFILVFASIWLLLSSQWNWNYLQPSIEDKLVLETSEYNIDELVEFTESLITETIKTKDNSNFDIFSNGTNSVIDISYLGYKELAKVDDFYEYKYSSIKYSIFSSILPYIGVSGYYNPFTSEAQIAKGIPIVQIPFVINHEIAHQLGIASEAEANFISYLASINNPLSTIQYSGNLNLLLYCLSDLRRMEYEDYDKIKKLIPENIKSDIEDIYVFWESYRNDYNKYQNLLYDKYLKSNNQKEGLNSYNKVVSLAIFYNRKK